MRLLNMSEWALWLVVGLFLAAAVTILMAGARMARTADRLADLTGFGEALFGAVLLGGSTSLPGIITSVTTAYQGYAELAVSNAVGGITVQTAFLAVADTTYRQANLEHAAASIENLLQSTLLISLLAIPLLAMAGPQTTAWGISPASIILVLAYIFGVRLIGYTRTSPLWRPQKTEETRLDRPAEPPAENTFQIAKVWLKFGALALAVAVGGYLVAQTGITLADRTGLSQTIVGAFLTAVATSLPELVTSISAVQHGALALAVGGVIGGNSFDVLFLAFADAAYRRGSIYHAMTDEQVFVIAEALLLTGILLLGLLRRERSGILGIGFESFLVFILYLASFALLFFTK